jgi:hypothetical protein
MIKSPMYAAVGTLLEMATRPIPSNVIPTGKRTYRSHCPALTWLVRLATSETRLNPMYPLYPQNKTHIDAMMRLANSRLSRGTTFIITSIRRHHGSPEKPSQITSPPNLAALTPCAYEL